MSFPRYPEYKDSGVAWLGEIPAGWHVSRLKNIVDQSRQITYGIVQAGPDQAGGIPYVRPADMTDERGVQSPSSVLRTTQEIAASYSRSAIRAGDLVCSIGPSFGKVMEVPTWLDGGNLTQGTARIAVGENASARFVFWVLRSSSSFAQWESSVGGATFRALNLEPLAETWLACPSFDDQYAIAAFLDRETAKIDVLVAEQEKLIALLKEKRQAVISHAVTKGLNPDAPMKPSGIEWLGDVPAHWEMRKLKYLGQAITGLTYSPDDVVEESIGTLVLRSSNVQGGQIALDDNVYVSCAIPELLVTREGDVLICSRNGSRALIGKNAMIDGSSSGVTFGAFMTVFRSELNEFLYWIFNSPLFEFQSGSFLTSTINQLTIGTLNEFEVPLPPHEDRLALSEYLARRTDYFGRLLAEANRAITLLKERRSALISAAVTGQIDVRGLTSQPAEAA